MGTVADVIAWMQIRHGQLPGWLWVVLCLTAAGSLAFAVFALLTNRWPGQSEALEVDGRRYCYRCAERGRFRSYGSDADLADHLRTHHPDDTLERP